MRQKAREIQGQDSLFFFLNNKDIFIIIKVLDIKKASDK
jgi:hypothetical protein